MSETPQDDFGPVSEIRIGITDEEIIEMIKDRRQDKRRSFQSTTKRQLWESL